jgi:site-specific DNA recombinase
MNTAEIKRVAIYTRVSTEEQAEHGQSLDAQLDKLKHFAMSKDPPWVVQDIYIEEGLSGRTIKRPQYQRMIQNISQWDAILVMKMDRIHRNSKNFAEMMDFLAKNHKDFISSNESLDTTTAMGRFFMDLMQRMAQFESEQIGERTYIGMRQKAKASMGVFNGHFRPYGYKIDDHQLIPEPGKLKIVKQAFELYDQGNSLPQICTITGLKFCTLQYILHNSIYAGFEQWCYIFKRAAIVPLISVDLFNRVQARMVERSSHTKNKKFIPLILRDVDSFEVPEIDRLRIPMLRCRMPKHKLK